jgi:endonuclease/exonuclease/phosphatase family metal-dependent hydrolase
LEGVTSLRLASYNLHKCVGPDGRRSPGRVIDVLNALGADVVALQEADRRLGPRPAALPRALIETATDFDLVNVDPESPSLGWHGNAVLVRRGLAARAVGRIALPGFEPRGGLVVEVESPLGPLRLAAVHLGLLRRDRTRQLRALRDELAGRTPMPTAILGDFNEWSLRKGMEPLGGTFSVVTPGRSFHALHPMAHLDRLALCGALALRGAGVLDTAPARAASDHLPVWADVAAA